MFENNSYQNPQPDNSDYQKSLDPAAQLARASFILSILSLASNFLIPVFLPLICASLAIILALLSRGSRRSLSSTAFHGVILSIVGIVISVVVFVYLIFSTIEILKTPELHEQLNQISEQINGVPFDEILREMEETFELEPGSLEFGGTADET